MSREIKFRQWSDPGDDGQYGEEWECWEVNPFSKSLTNDGNIITEQFTGLYDKSGKEIYEGDIIKYSFTNPKGTYIESVSFGPIDDGEGYFHQEFLAWRTTDANGEPRESLLDIAGICEVIGNVHENKDLLKGEK